MSDEPFNGNWCDAEDAARDLAVFIEHQTRRINALQREKEELTETIRYHERLQYNYRHGLAAEMGERIVNEAASLALGYATAHWMTQASLGLDITKSEISELHESWERSGAVRDLLGEQG